MITTPKFLIAWDIRLEHNRRTSPIHVTVEAKTKEIATAQAERDNPGWKVAEITAYNPEGIKCCLTSVLPLFSFSPSTSR